MSPYLLLGFLLAGLMHVFIPGEYYTRFLARNSFSSVLYAAIFGIPLPLCSCGVIPTAMSLRKEGASKGAVASFLIATPQTGVDSIIATFSLMGLPFAIIRPIAALATAIFGGQMVNTFSPSPALPREGITNHGHTDCCHANDSSPASHAAGGASASASATAAKPSITHRLKEALEYAYIEMMEDIGKWLVVGLIIAGLITVFVPAELFQIFQGNTLASMLLVLCIALPMYLCATGSIPIAVALMMKGLTPGAALVLLMAGPACNFASILVINKVLGRRTLVTYLVSIVIGAVAFGYLIDYLQFNGIVDFLENLTMQQACCEEGDSWFSWLCTAVLFLMLINALVLPKLGLRKPHHCHCGCHDHDHHDHCGCGSHEHEHEHHDHCGCESDVHDDKDGCCCHSHNEPAVSQPSIYFVDGMSCSHCRAAAEKALRTTPGVTDATVDLASKHATVVGTATFEELAEAVASVGFKLRK